MSLHLLNDKSPNIMRRLHGNIGTVLICRGGCLKGPGAIMGLHWQIVCHGAPEQDPAAGYDEIEQNSF